MIIGNVIEQDFFNGQISRKANINCCLILLTLRTKYYILEAWVEGQNPERNVGKTNNSEKIFIF
jgi:hypothetical protein